MTRAPGEKYEYSNLAVGLLGTALARRAGMSYEDAGAEADPGAAGNVEHDDDALGRAEAASGAGAQIRAWIRWPTGISTLWPGPARLRSTVNDMLKFLAANLEFTETPLKNAMRRLRAERRPTGTPDMSIAMGWHIFTKYGDLVWHNGGTGGYRTFAGFDPAAKRGAVVLCNTNFSVDDLGRHFVQSQYPAAKLPPPAAEARLETTLLDEYPGEYELAPVFRITIRRDGDKLLAQATNQPEFPIFATKKDEFFYKVVEARISFTRDAAGKVTGLVLHQGGRDMPGPKVK